MRIRDKFGFAADRIWANALDSEECCRFVTLVNVGKLLDAAILAIPPGWYLSGGAPDHDIDAVCSVVLIKVRYKDRTAIDFSDRWEEPLSVECSDFDLPFSLRVLKAAEAARLVEYTIKEAST